MADEQQYDYDVLVIGAGPAGSAAAAWAAGLGLDVVLADKETFPRDKACGDGLTPRAIAELHRRHHLEATPILRIVERFTRGVGRPA